MQSSTRLRTLSAVLAVGVGAMACSGTTDSANTTQPSAAPETAMSASVAAPPEPLLDIPSGLTWQQLLDEIADEDELACIDDLLRDELPADLLDITVTEPVGWPTVTTELIGIDIGDDQWPHELWRCLSPKTAAAAHLSVFAHEQQLARGFDIDAQSTACIAALPDHSDYADTAARVLRSEASFPEGDDVAAFMKDLDDFAAELILPCIPVLVEDVLAVGLAEALGDNLSFDELDCLVDVALDEARSSDVELSGLFDDTLSSAEVDRLLEPLLFAAIEACLSDDMSSVPDATDEESLAEQAAVEIVREGLGSLLGADEFGCAVGVLLSEAHFVGVDLAARYASDGAYEDPLAELMLTALAACLADDGTGSTNPEFPIAVSGREVYVVTQLGDMQNFALVTDDGGWHSSASWSPDGGRLAYSSDVDGDSEIYVVNTEGSEPRKLTDNAYGDLHPSWSPDGSRIAFQSDRSANGRYELYSMDADGSDVVQLTSGLYDIDGYRPVAPSWSPDGSRIAFGVGSGIISIDANGSERHQIIQGEALGDAAWSPDGTRIAYAEAGEGIWVVDADGSNPQRVTTGPHSYPAWSPDGTRLAFVDDEQYVLISNADGSDIRRLHTEPLGLWPQWSPIPVAETYLIGAMRNLLADNLAEDELVCATDFTLRRLDAVGLNLEALLLSYSTGTAELDERLDVMLELNVRPATDSCMADSSS